MVYSIFGYFPNKGAPIAFSVLFAISALIHLYQTIKYKAWRTGLLPWGGILLVAGYATREVAAYHTEDVEIYVATAVLLLLAPPVYAGANYFILGRTLYYVPYLSPIHPGRVVSTFIGLDVLVEILTGSGAPKVVNLDNPGQIAIGAALIKAALVMQLGIFLGFVAVAVTFHVRCVSANVFGHKIQTVMYVLYVSTALILTRSVYRTVEYFEGYGGYLGAHEAFFWVFEASLMLVNSVLLNVWHPGRYLPRSNNVYLSRDGVTEAVGPGWVDKRHFLVTIVDPFDIVGLIRGKDKETAFWEVEGRREGGFDGVTLSASERSKQPTTHTIATPSGDRV